MSPTWGRVDVRLRSCAAPISDSLRRRAIHAALVSALVAGGGLSCWVTFLVEQRLTAPASPPVTREVTFHVVVSDADTGNPVPGAEVGIDAETGEYDPPGPTCKGSTDAAGRVQLVHGFVANAVIGKDGKVRGLVVFNRGTSSLSFSDLLVVRAAGYRGETVSLSREFPRGVPYEDPSPRTVQVQLSPSHAR